MKKKLPIIIDCDPGHDDAVALLLAFASKELNVLGVSVTGGNQTLEKTLQNTKNILEVAGLESEVAEGLKKPLLRDLEIAPEVHGETGLDGPVMPLSTQESHELGSVEFMYDKIIKSEEKVTIVATGPLTNVGALLIVYPEIKEKIERISIMGGAMIGGNWMPSAEFNILVDPDAARVVFKSGVPIVMSGIDVTHRALIYEEEIELFRNIKTPVSTMVAELLDFFHVFHKDQGFSGMPLHDPCAVAYLVNPDMFTAEDFFVDIETVSETTLGATVVDQLGVSGKESNTTVLLDIDREAFRDMLLDAMEYYKERGY